MYHYVLVSMSMLLICSDFEGNDECFLRVVLSASSFASQRLKVMICLPCSLPFAMLAKFCGQIVKVLTERSKRWVQPIGMHGTKTCVFKKTVNIKWTWCVGFVMRDWQKKKAQNNFSEYNECYMLSLYIFWHEVKWMPCVDWLKIISL